MEGLLVAGFFKVLPDAVKAGFLGLVNHDACWRAALFRKAEAAVAYAATRRAYPSVVLERLTCALSVSVAQARATELAPYTNAVLVVADRLLVEGLLPALMTRRAVNFVIRLAFHALGDLSDRERVAVHTV